MQLNFPVHRPSSEINAPGSLHHFSEVYPAFSHDSTNDVSLSRASTSHGQTPRSHAMSSTPLSCTSNWFTYVDDDNEVTEEDSSEDDVTKFFAELITQNTRQRSDKVKFRFDGLHESRTLGFQGQSPRQEQRTRSTFHGTAYNVEILEIDGDPSDGNYVREDGAGVDDDMPEKTDVELKDVVEAETQHRIDAVAERLAAIGDRIANERDSESEMPDVEVIYPGRHRRLSEMELDVMQSLRDFADTRERKRRGKDLKLFMVPIIKDILAAQSYNSFKQIVRRELVNTHGWEQVAWYTYLIRTAVYIAGSGQQLGTIISRRAQRFFSSDLRQWIVSRPLGWESVHEETDIDTELK